MLTKHTPRELPLWAIILTRKMEMSTTTRDMVAPLLAMLSPQTATLTIQQLNGKIEILRAIGTMHESESDRIRDSVDRYIKLCRF